MGKGIASLLALSARTETEWLFSAVANSSRPVGIYNALIGGPSLRQPCLLPEEPFFCAFSYPWDGSETSPRLRTATLTVELLREARRWQAAAERAYASLSPPQ